MNKSKGGYKKYKFIPVSPELEAKELTFKEETKLINHMLRAQARRLRKLSK